MSRRWCDTRRGAYSGGSAKSLKMQDIRSALLWRVARISVSRRDDAASSSSPPRGYNLLLRKADNKPFQTVRDAIANLPELEAGETDPNDPLHTSASLAPLNLQRIKASKPGGGPGETGHWICGQPVIAENPERPIRACTLEWLGISPHQQ